MISLGQRQAWDPVAGLQDYSGPAESKDHTGTVLPPQLLRLLRLQQHVWLGTQLPPFPSLRLPCQTPLDSARHKINSFS